jgi:hypothetical protein
MFCKKTSFKKEKKEVNRLRIDLCFVKELVLEKKKKRLIG